MASRVREQQMQSLEVGKGLGVFETRKGEREAWSSENKVWGGRGSY